MLWRRRLFRGDGSYWQHRAAVDFIEHLGHGRVTGREAADYALVSGNDLDEGVLGEVPEGEEPEEKSQGAEDYLQSTVEAEGPR